MTLTGDGVSGTVNGRGQHARHDTPTSLTINASTETIFVTDGVGNTIRKLTP
ncbi:MAG: hypothetical protein WC890_04315 [Candidatus Margulisiibacteriota bacterium]